MVFHEKKALYLLSTGIHDNRSILYHLHIYNRSIFLVDFGHLCLFLPQFLGSCFRPPALPISSHSYPKLYVGFYWVDHQHPSSGSICQPWHYHPFPLIQVGSKSFQTFNLVSCGFSPLAAHGLITFLPLVALFYNPVRKQMLWLLPQWTLPVSWHFLAAFGCNFQLSKAQF